MTIGVLATITVREGQNSAFETAFLKLAAQVHANEPGNSFYALHRSQQDPQVYKVMEQYDSLAALEAHRKTDHFIAANQELAALVSAAPVVEILDAITA